MNRKTTDKTIVYARNTEVGNNNLTRYARHFRKPTSITYVTDTCYLENIPELQVYK